MVKYTVKKGLAMCLLRDVKGKRKKNNMNLRDVVVFKGIKTLVKWNRP